MVKTIEEAKAAKKEMDRNSAKKLAALAADFLAGHRMVDRPPFGAIGFSLGASLAIESARRRNKLVKAVVLFYGTGGGKFDKTNAAFMGHFAENDNGGVRTQKVVALED